MYRRLGVSNQKWMAALAVVVAMLTVAASVAVAASQAQSENTYIEFIFDSSLSMRDRINDGSSRMAVAKEVLRDVIGGLEDQPGLQIALRVYGSKTIDELACRDSELFQPFGRVAEVRDNILKTVNSLEPKGRTPIGYSLQLAAKDFPMNPGDRNIIVLITDGQESCGVDPCAVSYELQEQGIIMKPYVVGFAMSAEEEAAVRCIGEYYSASDGASLAAALRSILVKAIAPPSLEIEAYGGGQSVLNRTRIEILDSVGSVVLDEKPGSEQVMKASLPEGVYTVKGYLTVGPDTVVASQSGVTLVEGETTRVRLDFGALTGGLRVSSLASGRDVSDRVQIEVSQSGRAVSASWTGKPPTATLPAGEYLVKVTHIDYPSLSSQQTVRISPNKGTSVQFDLGELPAQLEVAVQVMGRDITSQCQLTVSRNGAVIQQLGTGNNLFSYTGNPGSVDLKVVHTGDVRTERTVIGTVLSGGETTRIVVDLSDVLGIVRATVLAGETDVTSSSRVHLDGPKATLDLAQRGGVTEAVVPAGFYGIKAFGQTGYESSTAEIDVVAGQVVTVTLKLNVPGLFELKPVAAGKAVALDKVSASVYRGQQLVAAFGLTSGRLTATVDSGTYDIKASYASIPVQERTITGVTVGSGMTKEVPVEFAPVGTLEVTVVAGGAPFERAAVHVYRGEERLDSLNATRRSGVFQSDMLEGEYDLLVVPTSDIYREQWVRGVKISAGGLVQKQVDLDAATRVRVNVVADDKPSSAVALYLYKAGQTEYPVQMRESDRTKGTFECYVDPGTYDLLVSPTVSGAKDRWITGLVVTDGQTLERRVQIGGSGKLRVNLKLDGKASRAAGLYLHEPGGDGGILQLSYLSDRGYYEIEVAEGIWDLEVVPEVYGLKTQWIEGIEVWGGETVVKDVSIGSKGTLQVTVLVNGRPTHAARAYAHPVDESYSPLELDRVEGQPGVFSQQVGEGTYDIEVVSDVYSIGTKWIEGVEMLGGQTISKEISLGGSGILRVVVLIDGKRDSRARVYAHSTTGDDRWFELEQQEGQPGVFALELAEGTWNIEAVGDIDWNPRKWADGIELNAGQVRVEQISLGGVGRIRIQVMVEGRPYTGAARIYAEDPETGSWWWIDELGPGVYGTDAPEGTYDVHVDLEEEGYGEHWIRGIEVVGETTTEKVLSVGGRGTLRIRLMGDGEIFSDGYAYLEDQDGWVADLEWNDAGQFFEVQILAGVYRLVIVPYERYGTVSIGGVEITEGQTLQRVVNLRPYE